MSTEHPPKHTSDSLTSPLNPDMKIPVSPARASTLSSNITSIVSRISATTSSHNISKPVRLVAVSKLKPASDILALHSPAASDNADAPKPQYHFGENYVQELIEKSRLLPKSIKWHFIGGLQSNKCKQLAQEVENLWAVESVDSVKKAQLLNKGRGERSCASSSSDAEEKDGGESLRVFVQVNTSGEDSKSGVEPEGEELVELCKYIRDECSNLQLQGVMTIGAIARSQATTTETENEDFACLREARDKLADRLGIKKEELELSMGMSEDFEGAIAMGSDEVRVGSTIFGERPPKKEARVLENTEEEKK